MTAPATRDRAETETTLLRRFRELQELGVSVAVSERVAAHDNEIDVETTHAMLRPFIPAAR